MLDGQRRMMETAVIMAKPDRAIIGNCGEYYVAAYLSGMGAKVVVERVNAPVKDLKVRFGGHSVNVQVKCGRAYNFVIKKKNPEKNYWVWQAGKKCMNISDKDHWYAFVSIGAGERGPTWPESECPPKVFFVPSKIVAKTLRNNDQKQTMWFWMDERVAAGYCGLTGFRKFKKAITG